MKKPTSGIVFNAIFQSAKTTIDGGWRITFDVLSHEAQSVIELAKLKERALTLAVVENERPRSFRQGLDGKV